MGIEGVVTPAPPATTSNSFSPFYFFLSLLLSSAQKRCYYEIREWKIYAILPRMTNIRWNNRLPSARRRQNSWKSAIVRERVKSSSKHSLRRFWEQRKERKEKEKMEVKRQCTTRAFLYPFYLRVSYPFHSPRPPPCPVLTSCIVRRYMDHTRIYVHNVNCTDDMNQCVRAFIALRLCNNLHLKSTLLLAFLLSFEAFTNLPSVEGMYFWRSKQSSKTLLQFYLILLENSLKFCIVRFCNEIIFTPTFDLWFDVHGPTICLKKLM